MNLPPLVDLRELPEEVRELILEQLVQEASPDLCGRLYERCLQLLGSGNCGAGHPIWRQACERFGLRRMVEADWRATFQRFCRLLKVVRDKRSPSSRRALRTFFSYVQGRAKELDIEDEVAALNFFQIHHLFMLREAFRGLGAVETPTPGVFQVFKDVLASGDVNLVKAAIGTGVNAGVSILFHSVFWISYAEQVQTHLEWIRLLLEAGVRTDAVYTGGTILSKAVKFRGTSHTHLSGYTQVVKLLLEHGVDPNYGGPLTTPLASLVKNAPDFFSKVFFTDSYVHAFEQVSRLLLDHGADPTLPDGSGKTALAAAEKWRDMNPDQRAFWDSYIEMLEGYARRANE
jgi:hypothetical protein